MSESYHTFHSTFLRFPLVSSTFPRARVSRLRLASRASIDGVPPFGVGRLSGKIKRHLVRRATARDRETEARPRADASGRRWEKK